MHIYGDDSIYVHNFPFSYEILSMDLDAVIYYRDFLW